nr:biotin--[acetyl-CoA-carboxylase] ligase [Acidobacteriota bacterium]
GLYLTLLLRPRLSPVQAPLLTMLAGISAHSAIQAQTGLAAELKWPNDLLLNGRKIGGILTEMHAEPNSIKFVIVGIGMNVNQEKFPAELSSIATSLRKETGRVWPRLELLARLLHEFESDYNRWMREGPAYVIERFQSISGFATGRQVRVDTGHEVYTGTTAGLSPEGLLLVQRQNGPLATVIAGDVTEVR